MIQNELQKDKSMDITEFPLDDLSRRCAEETQKFKRQDGHDTQYCYEIFRRALAERIPEAFEEIYVIYQPQVRRWVSNHPKFPLSGEVEDFFSHEALSKFYFALGGDKFYNFATLPRVMQYLKACVFTAVKQYVRDHPPIELLPDGIDIAVTSDFAADIEAGLLWNHLCALLPDKNDQLLARDVFMLDLRPRDMAQKYPHIWKDARQVSVDLFRIRRILMNDPKLRNWLKGEGTDD